MRQQEIRKNNDLSIFRYADVLLMKAEALLRSGNAGAALTIVNSVRAKRGVGNLAAHQRGGEAQPVDDDVHQHEGEFRRLLDRRLELARVEGQRPARGLGRRGGAARLPADGGHLAEYLAGLDRVIRHFWFGFLGSGFLNRRFLGLAFREDDAGHQRNK